MARVSIFYDKDEKEQFFMVRGDERYARSTSTFLEIGTSTSYTLNFDLDITVNVLRDVGEAYITIYDNDVAIYVIEDWDSTNNELTITLEGLNYDITHNLYARYMGNSKCSPSQSKTQSIFIENTNRAESILNIDDTTRQYPAHESFTKTITLTNDNIDPEASAWNHYQNIALYYDEVLIDTISTESGNTVTLSVPDTGNIGLHTIKVVYGGSTHLSAKTITQTVSVGYNIQSYEAPEIVIDSMEYSYKAKVTDWFDNPIVGEEVTLRQFLNHSSQYGVYVGEADTDSEGIATIVSDDISTSEIKYDVSIDNITYYSDMILLQYIMPLSIDVTVDPVPLSKGNNSVVTAVTNSSFANTPVILTGALSKTIYTNSDGVATTNYTGLGTGEKTFNAEFGRLSDSISVDDWLQYWTPTYLLNREYYLQAGNMLDLNNYFRILLNNSQNITYFGIPNIPTGKYNMKIEGINTDKTTDIFFIPNWNGKSFPDFSHNISYGEFNNAKITVSRGSDGTVSVVVNKGDSSSQVSYSNQNNAQPVFGIIPSSYGLQLDFNKLSLRSII